MPTERTCEQGCNGCDECTDFEDECERCRGDGMDPWNDYLLPCPLCQSEQKAAATGSAVAIPKGR